MEMLDVLRDLNVNIAPEGHQHTRHGWINFDCPFCAAGMNKYHMGYNVAAGYVNCWKCGRHRTVETLIELGMQPRAASAIYHNVDHSEDWVKPERTHLELPKSGELLPVHRKYLRQRGFDPEEIQRLWDVRGIGLHSTLAWRLLIPIHYQGEIVSWTTRSVGKDPKKRYHSASAEEESMNHKELLYGEDYCRHAVIVHEGPLDVWATGPGSVCTCGTSYTNGQVRRIAEYPKRIVCFDSQEEAQERAESLCDLLDVFPGETYNVSLETGADAAEADEDELEALRRYLK